MPMMKTFQLSKKRNNLNWVKPIINRESATVEFRVQRHPEGVPKTPTVSRRDATCIACGNTVKLDYVRERARSGKIGQVMIAIVADGNRGRLYLSPDELQTSNAFEAHPNWVPTGRLQERALGLPIKGYGVESWHQLFTERQLLTLTTFSDLIPEVRAEILKLKNDEEYAETLSTYLTLAISKTADSGCGHARWQNAGDKVAGVFGRQAIGMIWDFAEANAFSGKTQNWMAQIEWIAKAVERLPSESHEGNAFQQDASSAKYNFQKSIIVTDPPYYDNIGYADLSDFFYVWLRPLLRDAFPDLFAGLLTPKSEEMIAAPRFSDSRRRFEELVFKTSQLIRQKLQHRISFFFVLCIQATRWTK